MATIDLQLQQTVLQEVASLDNNDLLQKLHKYLLKLKKKETEASDVMTEADKKEILKDIKEALREMKHVQQGKAKTRPLEELLYEL